MKATSDHGVEGTLDHAVWYKDRLFLFSSPESLEAFSANPLPYAQSFPAVTLDHDSRQGWYDRGSLTLGLLKRFTPRTDDPAVRGVFLRSGR